MTSIKSITHRFKRIAAIALSSLLFACTSIGPNKLVASHEGYNDAVQLTQTREVLKNIVRIRYYDPIQFINITSINAQFSVNTGATVNGIATSDASIVGNIGYSDTPTLTYTPLSDAAFDKSLGTPISTEEAIAQFYHWGELSTADMGLVLGAVNSKPDRQGEAGKHYQNQLSALLGLINSGATVEHFREFYPRHESIKKDKISGFDYTLAAMNDLYFYDAGDNEVYIASKHMGVGLVVPKPHNEEVAEYLNTLGLTPGEKLYPMRSTSEAEPQPYGMQTNTLWLAPRSVEGMLELASESVTIPAPHIGIVSKKGESSRSSVKLPINIAVSKEQPLSIYRIQHRGYWFYVDDADYRSKKVLSTLVSAYSSRIGGKQHQDPSPQIVLPVAGM
ncbi:hypothetical protein [Shewanella sp. TC10]|uniref:hypothetical protein n=1 Tax=Shewanella sp. TC10 TaxID=1419739 RepID=UPI00129E0B6B|nr:hypothetical protein [Shewanella sp. TC10]